MSILFKTEAAMARVLWQIAPKIARDGIAERTDRGVKIQLDAGRAFELLILKGQDDVNVFAPALVARCLAGEQIENSTTTHLVVMQITLDWPTSDLDGSEVGLLDSFIHATKVLQDALYDTTIAEQMSQAQSGFSCIFARGVWSIESGWGGSETGRTRTFRLQRELIVTETDFQDTR